MVFSIDYDDYLSLYSYSKIQSIFALFFVDRYLSLATQTLTVRPLKSLKYMQSTCLPYNGPWKFFDLQMLLVTLIAFFLNTVFLKKNMIDGAAR